jgi:hypothetical protein
MVVQARGDCDLPWLKSLIPKVLAEHVRAPAAGVLVDARGIRVQMGDLDRYELGVSAAQPRQLPPIAFVAPAEIVDPRRLGELAARNRGANLRVFTDIGAAREWLTAATV